MATHTSLRRAVRLSVPQRMREFANVGGPSDDDLDAATAYLVWLSESGAVGEFRDPSRRVGRTPELFNMLARSVAALAFRPGGVTLFGETWDIKTTHLPE